MDYIPNVSPFGNLYNFRIARGFVVGSPVNDICVSKACCKKRKRQRRRKRR